MCPKGFSGYNFIQIILGLVLTLDQKKNHDTNWCIKGQTHKTHIKTQDCCEISSGQ